MNLISAWFLLVLSLAPQEQTPGAVILDAAVAELRKDEPSWNLSRGSVCNFPPLIEEQEKIFCGIGHRDARIPPQDVFASITLHYVSDAATVTRYLEKRRTQTAPEGWSITPYDIGVPASLGSYLSTGNPKRTLSGSQRPCFARSTRVS